MAPRTIHPATLAAAAAVLAPAMPEYGDPRKLLDALRLADQAKTVPADGTVPGQRLLTIAETASRLGVCKRSIQLWLASGDLPAIKRGPRYVRVRETDLSAFVDRMPPRPVTRPASTATAGEV